MTFALDDFEDPPTHFGSAYTLSGQDTDETVGRDFELQRGLLVPKDYLRTKLPIGFIWQ